MHHKLQIHLGDITKLNTDAIVNAANVSLLGGGGVDGAIHRAAGPQLLTECKKLNGCNIGEAKITKGYNLKAKYIIHTVGPRWRGGQHQELDYLKNCYLNSLLLSLKYPIQSIAFPCISTGIYGVPKELAANIAINSTLQFIAQNSQPKKIVFVVFDEDNLHLYERLLNANNEEGRNSTFLPL